MKPIPLAMALPPNCVVLFACHLWGLVSSFPLVAKRICCRATKAATALLSARIFLTVATCWGIIREGIPVYMGLEPSIELT